MPRVAKPYIVCCGANGRAVIYGYSKVEPKPGKPIRLEQARMVLYWSAKCGGLVGLAAEGPKDGTRITHTVGATGTEVVRQWVAVSADAAKGMDAWPAA